MIKIEGLQIVKDISHKTLNDILSIWESANRRYDKVPLPLIDEGGFSYVYEYTASDFKKFALKITKRNPDGSFMYEDSSKQNDERNLTILNGHPFFPTIYAYIDKEIMILDKIDGLKAEKFEYNNSLLPRPIKLHKNFVKIFQNTLDYMRGKGIEIRDIEPRNIIINYDGLAVIIDTGMCYMPSNGENFFLDGNETYRNCIEWSKQFFKNNYKE